MSGAWCLLIALFALLSACGEKPEEPVPVLPDPPSAAQIQRDLVGQRFVFFEDADGERAWTIEESEIRALDVVGQVVGEDGRGARSRVTVVLRAENRTISGDLFVQHRREGPNWVVEAVSRAGGNFRAGDRGAVLFAVEPLVDSTGVTAALYAEPIAVYDSGRYSEPPRPFAAAIEAFVDSTFASDSLRLAAEDSLTTRIASRYVARGRRLRLLRAGAAPAWATVDSSQVLVDGCQGIGAWLRADPDAREAPLATSSSVMGGAVAPGRPLTGPESRSLDLAARDRLALSGANPDRLRPAGATAIDLDGDGVDELVGAFTSGDATQRFAVAVAIRASAAGSTVLFERRPARGFDRLAWVGAVDVDGDGAAEAVFLEEGEEVYRYLIVTYRAGRYADAYRGGGGSC